MTALYRRGITVENYDQMIGEGNEAGNATVQHAVDALLDQTKSFERAIAVLDLHAVQFQGSKSLGDKLDQDSASDGAAGGEAR
jgi:putative iron-regulated protein